MSGFTNFTRDAIGGLNNFESGLNSLVNTTEQTKAKSRLVNSQKFQIQEAYKSDLQQFLSTLPMDTDQESYQSKAIQFTQTWRSKINEGAYDKQTLSWLNTDFLPSKKDSVAGMVNIAKDISTDVQTATYARNFSTLIGSDRSLSYDDAVSKYKTYYDQVKLGDVPMEFGIASPEDYARSIVAAKTLQAIQNDTDQNIGNLDWSTDKAIEKALSQHEGVLTSEEKVQVTNNAYQYVDVADSRRIQQAKEETLRFGKALSQAVTSKTYCDPKEIDTYIKNAPYRYSMEARAVKNQMNTYNDSITYNLQHKAYVGKGTLVSTDVLQSLTDESIAVDLMTEQLQGQALKMYQKGSTAGDVYAGIASADFWPGFDDALVKEAKLFAQANLASTLQKQLTEEKRVATADGVKVTAPQPATTNLFGGTTEKDSPLPKQAVVATPIQAAEPPSKQDSTKRDTTPSEHEVISAKIPVIPIFTDTEYQALEALRTENANLGNVSEETVKASNPVILDVFAAEQIAQWGMKIAETKGINEALSAIDEIKDLRSVLQEAGASETVVQGAIPLGSKALGYAKTKLIQGLSQQKAEEQAIKHKIALNQLDKMRSDRYFAQHPEELESLAAKFASEGVLTVEEASKNAKVHTFVNAGTYPAIMSQVKDLAKKWGSTTAERDRIEAQMDRWLANEYLENPDLYDDSGAAESIQKNLVDFADKNFGKKQLNGIMDLTKRFEDPDGVSLIRGLKDGSTRGLLNRIASGELDLYINNTAQENLGLNKDGSVAFEWTHYDAGQLRDFFTKQMGFADQYADLPDNPGGNYLKYIVETNVAYARTKATAINSFKDAFRGYNQNPADMSNVQAVWIGDTWAISDPEVKGLFWAPDLSSTDKPEFVRWSWGTMQSKANGMLDPSTYRDKGAISGFVPDLDSRKQASKLDETLENNNQRLQEDKVTGMERQKTQGFIARDTETKNKLDNQFGEFYYQVFKARTAFDQGAY